MSRHASPTTTPSPLNLAFIAFIAAATFPIAINAQTQVETPTFSVAAGTYASQVAVQIHTETPDATIRYTTDGNTPTSTTGTIYSAEITVDATQTVKAIAYADGMTDSAVASAAYTIVDPPSISAISPGSGNPGTQITITGTDFGASQGNGKVWLGSTFAAVTSWSATEIVATIAGNASSGEARVLQYGAWSNGEALEIGGITISSITPEYGLPGTEVTIEGTGFGSIQGTGQILLGSTLGLVDSWSDTEIVAIVAPGATSGDVRVTQGGRASNSLYFEVTVPQITAISPTYGTPNTTVTIEGTGFGSTQGTGSIQLGSKAATVLTWTDTEIVAVVATGAVSGIARVQQNSHYSKALHFSVPDGLGDILTLTPQMLNMTVGETRILQALDEEGEPVTGLTWASSDSGVVSLSLADPPVLTAVAAGHVTITAGTASADVTVSADELPVGTVLWSNTLDGDEVYSLVPAVPSPTGVADVFAFHYGETTTRVHAVTTEGVTAWTADFPHESTAMIQDLLIPDFAGGLIDIHFGEPNEEANYWSPFSVSQIDGLTGAVVDTYDSDPSDVFGGSPEHVAIHPDGTVFMVHQPSTESWPSPYLTGLEPSTGTQKFDVEIGEYAQVGQLIIAGDGNAYLPYAIRGPSYNEVQLSVLRVTSSGTATHIPVHHWTGGLGEVYSPDTHIITNADTGVLVTFRLEGVPTRQWGTAVISDSGVSLNIGSGIPNQQASLNPMLQAQDGSFIGTVYTDYGDVMVAFDSTGSVQWSVPNEYPAIATLGGGIMTEAGIEYALSGSVHQFAGRPVESWLGNRYALGSVQRIVAIPTAYATTFAALARGNPSAVNQLRAPTYLTQATLYLRSFAPWPLFGPDPLRLCAYDCFVGDDRSFSTSLTATARVTGIVTFWLPGGFLGPSRAFSDPSHDASHTVTATAKPQIIFKYAPVVSGYNLHVEIAGHNPLVPGSPDIDTLLNFSSLLISGQVCYSGYLYGDAFPNSEVLGRDSSGGVTTLHTFATVENRNTGPLTNLPGQNSTSMGTFTNVCISR